MLVWTPWNSKSVVFQGRAGTSRGLYGTKGMESPSFLLSQPSSNSSITAALISQGSSACLISLSKWRNAEYSVSVLMIQSIFGVWNIYAITGWAITTYLWTEIIYLQNRDSKSPQERQYPWHKLPYHKNVSKPFEQVTRKKASEHSLAIEISEIFYCMYIWGNLPREIFGVVCLLQFTYIYIQYWHTILDTDIHK